MIAFHNSNFLTQELAQYKQMVEQIIDVKAIEKGEFLVCSSFDDRLKSLKESMDSFEMKMEKIHSRVIKDLGIDSVKLEYVSHLGYHFRVTLKDEEGLRGNKKYKKIDALKSGCRFTNDDLENLNEDFLQSKQEYEEQQQSIVEEVIKVAAGYLATFTRLNNQIAELDCLLSFAIAAVSAPTQYVKPKMFDETPRVLDLKGMRHPCLELQENITFIANDVAFKDEETNMYIITGNNLNSNNFFWIRFERNFFLTKGPNMGGKSTYIRSVGAAVLMAHIGSFVACDVAHIPYVDSILGRIGADDNISKGLSTFMVEMIETAGIIRVSIPR